MKKRKDGRTSENAKGKPIEYTHLEMAEYLCASEEDISIEEKKWHFKCRVEDIEVKANHRWKFTDITCGSCKNNIEETQSHTLNCHIFLGKNENVTYIPDYNELYIGNLSEQIYVSRLIKENYNRRVQE